jgi:CRISPR-associated protein Csd1
MSLFQRLCETFDSCIEVSKDTELEILPISHTIQKAHIEVTIDSDGNFLRATVLDPGEDTIIPATEDSASRSSNCSPHGFADKIQYCAKDYKEYGGRKNHYFNNYCKHLAKWCNSEFSNSKISSIFKYLMKGNLIKDLVDFNVLWFDENKKLLVNAEEDKKDEQKIFKQLPNGDQGDAFVRWRVQVVDDKSDCTWKDDEIRRSWINFIRNTIQNKGLCYVQGKQEFLSEKHPSRIRHSGDKAKLISSNDNSGFTFRGRFEDSSQALNISFEVSQKAHNTLKWLLDSKRKQAYRNGNQMFVAWSVHGHEIPKPFDNSFDFFEDEPSNDIAGSVGKVFGEKLAKKMKGYTLKLGNANTIMILGIDSATTGRLSVIYYKELEGSDFLNRIESWHRNYSWLQYYGEDKRFYGAPSLNDIAEIAYGKTLDDNLKKFTVKRILPCIIENKSIPEDLVSNWIKCASNPIVLERWQWRKALGIACALYKGNKYGEAYEMALDKKNADRNYLYGRLLAVIYYAERVALNLNNEQNDKQRETNAQKYMHLFSIKPYSTWVKLYDMFNVGYIHKLLNDRRWFLLKIENILQEINSQFTLEQYKDNSKLSGEFLLGYFCQLADLDHHTNSYSDSEKEDKGFRDNLENK